MGKRIVWYVIAIICGFVLALYVSGVVRPLKETQQVESVTEKVDKLDELSNLDGVVIEDGIVNNEVLLTNFVSKTGVNYGEENELKIFEIENGEIVEKNIKYYPGLVFKIGETGDITTPNHDSSYEEFKEYYGYYIYTDGEVEKEYRADNWALKLRVREDKVDVVFDASELVELVDESNIPVVCSYSIESSSYNDSIKFLFETKEDAGRTKVFEGERDVYTQGGEVYILTGDMVIEISKALKDGTVSIEDIVNKCKIDVQFGMCKSAMLSDGGTIEYHYDDFTIMVYNSLDGVKDIVIGRR